MLRWQIYLDRKCDAFTTWRQGSNPKEHREMLDRQRLLEFQTKREDDWQKFQAQLAAGQAQMASDDKKWREERAADDKKWREEQEARAEQRHKQEMTTLRTINKMQMLVMGLAVTGTILLVTMLSSVVGGAIQAGWFPKWFGIGQAEQPITQPVPDTPSVQPPVVSGEYP